MCSSSSFWLLADSRCQQQKANSQKPKNFFSKNFPELLRRFKKSVFLPPHLRDVSPVGSERCLHTAEVTGSSPVRPTKQTVFVAVCFFVYGLRFTVQSSRFKVQGSSKKCIFAELKNV